MTNPVLDAIAQRFSCRKFKGQPVEAEKLEALALAAVQAPSGMNLQPWSITVLSDKAMIETMDDIGMAALKASGNSEAYERFMSRGGNLLYNAPALIVIGKKAGADLDCGIVTQNIALAAHAQGLDSVICGMLRLCFEGEQGAPYAAKLGLSGEYSFGMSVLVGYGDMTAAPHAPDLSKITYVK